MRPRSLLATAAVAAVFAAVPLTAQAACQRPAELISRTAFNNPVEQTAGSFHIAGATSGELGGFFDLRVVAKDGSLPTGSEVCEPAIVTSALTVSPGEVLSSRVKGELCTSFFGDALILNAPFRTKDLHYSGTAHHTPKVVGDGLIAANVSAATGGLATFSATIRW